MEGLLFLAIFISVLVVLDLAAAKFGVDSRDAFEPRLGILD
jgi:hypothetical protein